MPEVRADLTLDASDAVGVVQQLADDIDAALSNATLNLDTSAAEADINALGSEPIDIPVTADTAEASTDINALADAPPVDIPVTADTAAAEADINALGDAQPVEVPVSADTSQAQHSIDSLDAEPVEIEVTANTDEASAEIEDFGSSLEGAGSDAEQFGGKADAAGGAAVGLASGLSAGVIGAVGLSFGLDKAITSAVAGVDATQRLSDAMGIFRGVADQTPPPLNNIKTSLHDLAHEVGLTFAEIDGLRRQTFQFGTGLGLSGFQVLSYSDRMTALALSVHAVHPELGSVETIAATLEKRLGSGSTALRKYGIDVSKDEVALRVWQDTLDGTNAGLDPGQSKALAGAEVAWEKYGSTVEDNVAKGIDKPQTKLDKLKASFEDFLGSVVAPVAIPVLDGISNWVDENLTSGKLANNFKHHFLEPLGDVVASFRDDFLHPLGQFGTDFGEAFGSVGSGIVGTVHAIGQAFSSTRDAIGTAGSAVADFGHGVVNVGGDAAHAFGQAVTSVHDFASTLASTVADIGGSVGSKVADIANRIGDGFTNAKNIASDAIGTIKSQIGSLVGRAVDIVINVATGALDHAIDLIHTVLGFAGRVVSLGTDVATGAVSSAIGLLQNLWSYAGRVVSMGSAVATGAISSAIDLAQRFIGFSGRVVSMSVSVATGAIDTAISLIQKLLGFAGKVVDIAVHIPTPSLPTIPGTSIPYASGGPIAAGTVAEIGEQGREIFVPATDGFIIPNGPTEQILGGGFDDSNMVSLLGRIARGIEQGGGDIHISLPDGRSVSKPMDNSFLRGRS